MQQARPTQVQIFNEACEFVDQGQFKQAEEYISHLTLQGANQGTSIFVKNLDKTGDESQALVKGIKISHMPGADGKFDLIDSCQYCDKADPYFKEPSII